MPTKKTTKKAASKKSTARKTSAKKKTPAKKTTRKVAKKVTKKTTKKTSSKKSTARKKSDKKPLVYADDQKSFWVTNGQILNSLAALKDALSEMEKDVYLYHATGDQNDFACWVDEVLCDDKCAQDLAKAKTPKSAQTVVVRHLKLYAV